ncbi:MAG: hypothetical protein WBE05_11425, partial [Pseudolabrys sp.]
WRNNSIRHAYARRHNWKGSCPMSRPISTTIGKRTRVTRPPSERRRLGGLELVSGMPVEVFLQTGSRTMMS